MSTHLCSQTTLTPTTSIGQAALETLAYSDIFDYPLRLDELHRYLSVPATVEELECALAEQQDLVACIGDYYFIAGRQAIVSLRISRERISRPALHQALRIGQILGKLPFIRMVCLTGSLAVLNSDETADLDYMLVAVHGRVWMARAFAVALGRLSRLFGYTLCPNLLISDRSLAWRQHELYTAREICQMIPIAGAETYDRLRCINEWTGDFLPNASGIPPMAKAGNDSPPLLKSALEWMLLGGLGDRLEAWEMERKVRRFTHQAGYGAETRFNADVCQGNFDHHAADTRRALRDRLVQLGIRSPVTLMERQPRSGTDAPGSKPVPESASGSQVGLHSALRKPSRAK